MRKVERGELLPLHEYEVIRDRFRARVIEHKRARRVALGPHMSAVFEDRDTVLHQVQEMLRTERITREDAVVHELETYTELIPGHNELSLTLFVGMVIGGAASISGAIYGALFIVFVPNLAEEISKAVPGAIFGVILILFMFFAPGGIASLLAAQMRRLRAARPG